MKFQLEKHLPYAGLTLLVLALFYGIYFAKMLAQKRQGIQTNQIGQRKEKSLHRVEVLMGVATAGVPAAQLLSVALGWSLMPAGARFTGFCLGLLGDLIFLASVLRMRDSWRAGIPKKAKPSWLLPAFTNLAVTRPFWGSICNTRACCCCTLTL